MRSTVTTIHQQRERDQHHRSRQGLAFPAEFESSVSPEGGFYFSFLYGYLITQWKPSRRMDGRARPLWERLH